MSIANMYSVLKVEDDDDELAGRVAHITLKAPVNDYYDALLRHRLAECNFKPIVSEQDLFKMSHISSSHANRVLTRPVTIDDEFTCKLYRAYASTACTCDACAHVRANMIFHDMPFVLPKCSGMCC